MEEDKKENEKVETPAAVEGGEEAPKPEDSQEPTQEAESLTKIKAAYEARLARTEEEARKRAEAAQAALAERDELIAELLGDDKKQAPGSGPMCELFARKTRMKRKY